MPNLRSLMNEIARQADDFLADASTREEARASVAERLQAAHPSLPSPDRAAVIKGVIAILEEEDFFVGAPGLDEFASEVFGSEEDSSNAPS